VIPLIAALLAMGVPLAPVMAFWLASPLMDPSMFVLTAGVLGLSSRLAKTLAAVALGSVGGWVVHLAHGGGGLSDPLRDGIGDGGCGGSRCARRARCSGGSGPNRRALQKFRTEATRRSRSSWLKWLTLAFLLESLMLRYIPAELVTATSWAGRGCARSDRDAGRRAGLSERLCRPAAGRRADRAGDGAGGGHGLPDRGRRHLDPRGDRRLGAGPAAGLRALSGAVTGRGLCGWGWPSSSGRG
jgi:hypothetical protein